MPKISNSVGRDQRCSERRYYLEIKRNGSRGFPSRGKHKGGFERGIGVSTYTSLKRGVRMCFSIKRSTTVIGSWCCMDCLNE